MEKRITYYVNRKNLFTWLAALMMVSSAVLRIAYFCGKGADSKTMWLQLVLPAAACLIFALNVLLDGKEHFYRTTIPVAMAAIYFLVAVGQRTVLPRYVLLHALVYLAFVIFYKQMTSGHIRQIGLLLPMCLLALVVSAFDSRAALTSGVWKLMLTVLPDLLMVAGLTVCTLAVRPHLDGAYHPTWGDRVDGRRVRTLPPMAVASPYLMVQRNESSNFIFDDVEITEIEKYIRQKRKEGLTGIGITQVFVAAYVRAMAQYPGLNRFLSGQRVYSRGDDIQYCMVIKKEMNTESPDTAIKIHFSRSDTIYDVCRKMEEKIQENKNAPLNSNFDQVEKALCMLPGLLFRGTVSLLKFLDYFGLLPKFLLEVSPFHGSMFLTSMGSLGIPPIVHHLYDFGNLPAFVALGCKEKRNELQLDGTVKQKKYVGISYNLDERICDGFYYATAMKYIRRILADPYRLDNPPETIVEDIL